MHRPDSMTAKVTAVAVLLGVLIAIGWIIAAGQRTAGRATAPAQALHAQTGEAVAATAHAEHAAVDATATGTDEPRRRQIAEVRRALLEGSLRGTETDGAIHTDAAGNPLLDLALRHWFDYHLSLVGEVSPQAIRAYLQQWLIDHADQYPPQTQRAVIQALDRYLAYLAAIDQAAAGLNSADARQRDQLLRQLRRQYLGEQQTQGFFADEEAYADYRNQLEAVRANTELTHDQRRAQEQQLIAALPDRVREPLVQQQRAESDLDLAGRIDQATTDPQRRFESRQQAFGAETAARLELADREQSQWLEQLAADTAFRRELDAGGSLPAEQRAERLAQWRLRNLSATDRQRIEALEEIGQLPDAAIGP